MKDWNKELQEIWGSAEWADIEAEMEQHPEKWGLMRAEQFGTISGATRIVCENDGIDCVINVSEDTQAHLLAMNPYELSEFVQQNVKLPKNM